MSQTHAAKLIFVNKDYHTHTASYMYVTQKTKESATRAGSKISLHKKFSVKGCILQARWMATLTHTYCVYFIFNSLMYIIATHNYYTEKVHDL